ncbi:Gram-negative bacteria binding protein 3 [Carabus blaptoides fortunei]
MLLPATLLLCAFIGSRAQDFEVPEATVEVFKPKGLRVSIPDVDGIKLFAFHAKINEPMNGREGGTFSRDITRAKDGRWTFYDPQAKLKVGDTIYYWTYADYHDGERKLGYVNDDREFVVTELIQLNGKGPGKKTTPTPPIYVTNTPSVVTTVTPPIQCSVFSQTTVNGNYACKGQLIFEDNFQTLNQKKWKTENKISGPDYQFVIYMNFPENVGVRNNLLYLKPTLSTDRFGENFINEQVNLGRNCTGIPGTPDCDKKAETYQILPPIISGRVKTKDTFAFRYGKVDIRAKLPKGNWIYPELFLQPAEFAYGLQYDSGQMRVAFSAGNAGLGNELQGGVILGTTEEARRYGMRKSVNDEGEWSDNFHVYSLHWTPHMISLSVDGTSYGTIEPPKDGFASQAMDLKTSAGQRWVSGDHIAPFDKEFYLSLGVGVGGHSFPNDIPGKPWKNDSPKNTLKFWQNKNTWRPTWSANSAMQVDYVKVWAL